MLLTILLWAFDRAEAGTPVRLPPEENPADWREALAIAGLSLGTPGDGAWVEFVPGPTQWTVRVRDARGEIHETTVAPPKSEVAREDAASLAASLLVPVYDVMPTVPPPAPDPAVLAPAVVPVTPPPAPVRRPPPKPTPPPPAVEPAPEPTPPPAPTPEPAPAPPPEPPAPPAPPPPHAELRAGVGVDMRGQVQAGATGWLDARVANVGSLSFGVALGGTAPMAVTVPSLDSELIVWSAEASAGIWYAAPGALPVDFGVAGGAAVRGFAQDGGAVQEPLTVPIVATSLDVGLERGPVRIEPGLRLQVDVRPIDIISPEGTTRIGDWSLRAGVAVRFVGESAK